MASATGVRLTLKFNFAQQIRAAGWSESYDLGYADIPTAVAAIANITRFMNNRCNCLGIGPLLVSAILTEYKQPLTPGAPPVRRNTLAIKVPPLPPAGSAYNSAITSQHFTADFASTVFFVRLQTNLSSSPVYSRNLWMAGLPDASDITSNAQIVDPSTLDAVEVFEDNLQNVGANGGSKNNVSIRSIDRSGANPVKQCTAWNLLANTYTVPAHGFVVGQPVLAEGMKPIRGGTAPRGRYLIGSVVDVNTITLAGAGPPSQPTKTGGFRAAIVTFNVVAVATPQGFTKRDKGRFFGQSVGRRPRPATTRA